MHGGKSPSGPASATWINGRHTKDPYWRALSGELLRGYLAVETDEQLLSLREQIRLWSGREVELVARRAESGMPSEQAWRKARAAIVTIDEAKNESGEAGVGKLATALNELRDILLGDHGDAIWRELREATLVVRRLKESERRLLETKHQMLSTEAAMHLMALLTATALKRITDEPARIAFADDVRRLAAGERVAVDPELLPRRP